MNSKYKIAFSIDSEKTLKKLDKPTAKRIFNSLELLSNDPWNNSNTKKMKGTEKDIYRLRVGNYRIIYEIFNNELIIFVVRVG